MKPNVRASASIERGEAGRVGRREKKRCRCARSFVKRVQTLSRAVVSGRTRVRVQQGTPDRPEPPKPDPKKNRKMPAGSLKCLKSGMVKTNVPF
jgi:hypothetical protein